MKIITDSKFTIDSMTKWVENWRKHNWMKAGGKEPVKNKEDFKILYSLCRQCIVKWVCSTLLFSKIDIVERRINASYINVL